jgi:hypothetical protein
MPLSVDGTPGNVSDPVRCRRALPRVHRVLHPACVTQRASLFALIPAGRRLIEAGWLLGTGFEIG